MNAQNSKILNAHLLVPSLTNSSISSVFCEHNAKLICCRGENCLHLLSRHPKENAAAIFHMLIQVAPGFPINKQDSDGNTGALNGKCWCVK